MNVKGLDYTCLTLSIIGAINWGLIGIFRFDLVAFLFGDMSWLSRIIYTLVGLSVLTDASARLMMPDKDFPCKYFTEPFPLN